jgi:hypothetical protein
MPARGEVALTSRDLTNTLRELCERDFATFVRHAWPVIDTAPLVANWHIKVLCDHLQAVEDGKIRRLLINICPGSAKSMIVAVLFPAWLWARNPSKKILSASYSQTRAVDDSTKSRWLIESEWYQRHWPTEIRDDANAKSAFTNSKFGSRVARPMVSLTGARANVVIIDDPHSVDDAKSDAYRKTTVATFLEAVPSRLNDPSKDAIIVVMQRLHEEDVSGAILARPELGYDHLCIPLLADGEQRKPTSIGWIDTREEGENMFPARYTPDVIREYRSLPLVFSGQYQQRPAPKDDGYFQRDWFNRFSADELPTNLHHYITSDHAPGGKEKSDFNVIRVWGVDANRNLWLVDSFRKKCQMDEALGLIREANATILGTSGVLPFIRKYKPLAWFPENDNTWVAIRSWVEAAMREHRTWCRIDPLPTKGSGDKAGKAQAYAAMASMGLVHLPIGPVGDEAIAEYVNFPNARHDGAIARAIADVLPAHAAPIDKKRDRSRVHLLPVTSDSDEYWC